MLAVGGALPSLGWPPATVTELLVRPSERRTMQFPRSLPYIGNAELSIVPGYKFSILRSVRPSFDGLAIE